MAHRRQVFHNLQQSIFLQQLGTISYCICIITALLSISIASVGAYLTDLLASSSVGLCVSVSVWKVYYGKMADWIWMPFGMVSGVDRLMGVLNGGDRRRGKAVLE